ncbi:hypothetical protein Ahy_A10g049951 isoform A [Arachis hypogaea]|uniref:Uncharacterized protein n=1 Tax=Arachis hypogaea TaxID=3818 RepID=A0A445B8A2_ARAHY|nr:hypothetical protein Ahy_A10g049951 isoform A [Arachis hypogaea]
MEGQLKFDDRKKEMNLVGMSYDFDLALENFESDQKLKGWDISLCPRYNAIFDAEATATFEKERMMKELAHREEDAYYKRNPQWGHRGPPRGRYPYFHGQARGCQRGRGRRGRQPSNVSPVDKVKGATPSVHSRIVFPTDGETYSEGVPSPVKLDKGKAVVTASDGDKDKVAGLYEKYFEEGEDEMVSTISIIPNEYLGEYESNPVEDYNVDDEEAFSFIRYEDEPVFFRLGGIVHHKQWFEDVFYGRRTRRLKLSVENKGDSSDEVKSFRNIAKFTDANVGAKVRGLTFAPTLALPNAPMAPTKAMLCRQAGIAKFTDANVGAKVRGLTFAPTLALPNAPMAPTLAQKLGG